MNKIIVLGGGFAGVETAIRLQKLGHHVTLVSNRDYLFIYPISIWIPVKKKSFNDVKIDLEKLKKIHGFDLIIDEVKTIDSKMQTVHLRNRVLEYDYLFIALGMHKKQLKGAQYAHSICGHPEESVVIRKELDKLIAKKTGKIAIGFGVNEDDPSATAVRGGPAFELLFNFSYYLRKKGLQDKIELHFFAPMKEPGRRMGQKPYDKMDLFFKRYKIIKHIGTGIREIEDKSVAFMDGTRIESDLTVFIPAGDGHDVIKQSGLPVNKAGFIKINELCRVKGLENVYAVGDIAELGGPKWAAKQGHIAEVMADVATFNFHNKIKGKPKRKSYWEQLHIVCLMDSGDGGAFIVRNRKRDFIIPLPVVGHWMKKGWGFYYKNSKLKKIPRLPGM